MKQKFKLVGYGPETIFEPRKVEFIKWVTIDKRDDWVWALADPRFEPIPESPFSLVEHVLLSARHEGYSLKSFDGPTHVYVCTVKSESLLLADKVDPEDVTIMYWGRLLTD